MEKENPLTLSRKIASALGVASQRISISRKEFEAIESELDAQTLEAILKMIRREREEGKLETLREKLTSRNCLLMLASYLSEKMESLERAGGKDGECKPPQA